MEDPKKPEHFAGARVAIERRRARVIAEHNTALGVALATIDADAAALAEHERFATEISERYSIDNYSTDLRAERGPAPTKTTDRRRSPSKKPRRAHGPHAPYSPADDARIMEAARGRANAAERFGSLARDMGRTVGGVERHFQELAKRPSQQRPVPSQGMPGPEPETPAEPSPTYVELGMGALDPLMLPPEVPRAAPDQLGSENTPIVEASEIEEVSEPIDPSPWEPPPTDHFDEAAASSEIVKAARAQEATKLRRPAEAPYSWPAIAGDQARVDPADIGRSTTGAALDNGPKDRRVYHHSEAYTSRNSD